MQVETCRVLVTSMSSTPQPVPWMPPIKTWNVPPRRNRIRAVGNCVAPKSPWMAWPRLTETGFMALTRPGAGSALEPTQAMRPFTGL